MTENEWVEYKKNYNQKAQNRLYSSWYNPDQLTCKNIGLSSKCFCDHPYKSHDYLDSTSGKVKCKQAGCKCSNFMYIPIHGSQDFKCNCKHSYLKHDVNKKSCTQCTCKDFGSSFSCTCGYKYADHKTVHEKQEKKEEKGESVGIKNGGVISYSSMLDGAERFGYGIKEEVKKKGMKVQIEEFQIPKQAILQEEISAFELMNRPFTWLK